MYCGVLRAPQLLWEYHILLCISCLHFLFGHLRKRVIYYYFFFIPFFILLHITEIFLLLVSPPVYIAIWVFLPATPSFRKETSVCPLNSKFEHRFHVQIKLRQQTFYSVLSIIYIFNGHLLNIQGQEDH